MANAAVLLSFIVIGAFLSTTSSAAVAPSLPPSPTTPLIVTILADLGFQELAAAAASNLSAAANLSATIFAPTEASLLTCPSCSASLLLQEHSVLGLYPIHFLRRLAFGTKIASLAANRCLTVTASATADSTATRKVFINGVEIVKPDLFNNGRIIVHAIQGYVSHLSPLSCTLESMTSLSFQPQPPSAAPSSIMRFMLKDAMRGLRVSGYSIAALALRVKYSDLLELKSMTLFAVDDVSVFFSGGRGGGGGKAYVAEMGFHIVPNRLLTAADLIRLPNGRKLPTMERGRNLVVTSPGGGGLLAPMRINFVKLEKFDLVVNKRIVVHGLSTPFSDVDNQFSGQALDSVAAKAPAAVQ